MDFDCTTCSATLSSPSVTGRFLKKVTSISEAGGQGGRGGGGVVMGPEVWTGLLLQPEAFYHSVLLCRSSRSVNASSTLCLVLDAQSAVTRGHRFLVATSLTRLEFLLDIW